MASFAVKRDDKIILRIFVFILDKDARLRAHPTYVTQLDCDTYVLRPCQDTGALSPIVSEDLTRSFTV